MSERLNPPSAFDPLHVGRAEPFDPFRLCVYTTIGLLAWVLTPAVVVAAFSGIALVAYVRARRTGLVKSRCKLGDTRLVMVYLALLFVAGVAWTTYRLLDLVQ